MEPFYGKYQIINSGLKLKLWRKNDRKYIVFIIAFYVIGIIIVNSSWLNLLSSKQEFSFLITGLTIMSFFLLTQFVYNRKQFALTNQYLYLFPEKIVIKSDKEKELLIDKIDSIDFKYNGPDLGFNHYFFNPKKLHGNLNFIVVKSGQQEIILELYLPKSKDKIWITKALINYRNLIEKRIAKVGGYNIGENKSPDIEETILRD